MPLKPSNIKRMQQKGQNPLMVSSAMQEAQVNELGRKYKISKISDPGRKYYEQPNGSWGWNVPKVSVKPGTAEVLSGNTRVESPSPEIEAPTIEAPAEQYMNGKDPQSRPPSFIEAPTIEAPAIKPPAEQVWNDSDPDPVSRSRKKFQYCQKYGCNRGRRNSNSSQKTRRRRASRKHRRTYRK